MAKRNKEMPRAGARELNAALRQLVDAMTDAVYDKLSSRLVERDRVDDLEREIRQLSREVRKNAQRFAEGRVGRPPSNRTCEIEGCQRRHVAQGYCSRHYQAWRRAEAERAASRAKPARKKKRSSSKRARRS